MCRVVLLALMSLFSLGAVSARGDDRSDSGPRIILEIRFVTVPEDSLEACGLHAPAWVDAAVDEEVPIANSALRAATATGEIVLTSARAVVESRPAVHAQKLSLEQTVHFMRQAQQGRRTSLLFAPKVTVRSGEEAIIDDGSSKPLVAVRGNGSEPAGDVTWSPADMGRFHLRLRPEINDQGQLTLAVRVRLQDDVAAGETPAPPALARTTIELAATLDAEEHLVIWSVEPPKTFEPEPKKSRLPAWLTSRSPERVKTQLVLLVSPRVISAESADGTEP